MGGVGGGQVNEKATTVLFSLTFHNKYTELHSVKLELKYTDCF